MNTEDPTCFDVTPYLRLFIDKDGRWYQNGAEIVHPGILRQFSDSLEMVSENHYRIRIGKEICSVEVEDAPFVVARVIQDDDGKVSLQLNDGTVENFDPDSFQIKDGNIPYTRVRNGRFPARFSRPAYYQFAEKLIVDDGENNFSINLNGRKIPVKIHKKS